MDRRAQVLGIKQSADTRKALRFFAERRVQTHSVDFVVRGPSPGEPRRSEWEVRSPERQVRTRPGASRCPIG